MDTDRILPVVLAAVREFNETLPEDRPIAVAPDAPLYGDGGPLDSLELVNFIVELEQRLDDELGLALTLADEKAMAYKTSPFRSVTTLVGYLQDLVRDA